MASLRAPAALLFALLAACAGKPAGGGGDLPVSADGREAAFLGPDGRAPGGCGDGSGEVRAVPRLAMRSSAVELGRAGGYGRRPGAVAAIVAARAGADGAELTDDDVRWSLLSSLDAVPQVGPRAFALLLAAVRARSPARGAARRRVRPRAAARHGPHRGLGPKGRRAGRRDDRRPLEPLARVEAARRVLERRISTGRAQPLAVASARPFDEALLLWTAWEALGKRTGGGVFSGMMDAPLCVDTSGEHPTACAGGVRLRWLLVDGHLCCVARAGPA